MSFKVVLLSFYVMEEFIHCWWEGGTYITTMGVSKEFPRKLVIELLCVIQDILRRDITHTYAVEDGYSEEEDVLNLEVFHLRVCVWCLSWVYLRFCVWRNLD